MKKVREALTIQEIRHYTIEFSSDELDLIMEALNEYAEGVGTRVRPGMTDSEPAGLPFKRLKHAISRIVD